MNPQAPGSNPAATSEIDIICDVRDLEGEIEGAEDLYPIWELFAQDLVGMQLSTGQQVTLSSPQGTVVLTVVDAHGVSQVSDGTLFNVIDLWRSPTILYPCRVCREQGQKAYGPFRCTRCEEENKPERLCEKHAYFLKNAQTAYCPDHIPSCECRPGCPERATFRCERCHRLFGDHFETTHPKDSTTLLCQRCYRYLFERCNAHGCGRLGKSKCAYLVRDGQLCNVPLCPKHSFQWKIWLPHNRGVTLCEHHARNLPSTPPQDMFLMMLLADPPSWRVRHLLWNPYRLRRIVNRERAQKMRFDQVWRALDSISTRVHSITPDWFQEEESERVERKIQWIHQNYERMREEMANAMQEFPHLQAQLLSQIKAFYQAELGWDAPGHILDLEIEDCYKRPGIEPRYRISLQITPGYKGRFIGRGGVVIRKLQDSLNLSVNIQD